jgi:hypothetical protein
VRYYKLADNVTIPGRWHLSTVETPHGLEPLLVEGTLCSPVPLSAKISHPGNELDFSLTSFAVPVARSSLAAAIEAVANGDVQRLPLAIPGHNGFEVINALRVISCLDESRSEFTKWTPTDHRADLAGQYRMVTNLKILPGRIPADAHVLRVEGWTVALVISEVVKAAMERAGCFGAKFVEVT